MGRGTWNSRDPLVKFGAGYHPPRITKLAIQRRAAERLRTGAYERVIRSLRHERSLTEAALEELSARAPSKERDLAMTNASAHASWLLRTIAEVRSRRSLPKPMRSQPMARRTRIGLLAREAEQFRRR